MNTGAPAGMPSLRIHRAWPASWTNSSSTNSTANFQPHSSVYAPTEMTIVTAVVTKPNLAAAKRTNLSFRIHWKPKTTAAMSGPPMRRAHMRSELCGWIGRSSKPGGSGAWRGSG